MVHHLKLLMLLFSSNNRTSSRSLANSSPKQTKRANDPGRKCHASRMSPSGWLFAHSLLCNKSDKPVQAGATLRGPWCGSQPATNYCLHGWLIRSYWFLLSFVFAKRCSWFATQSSPCLQQLIVIMTCRSWNTEHHFRNQRRADKGNRVERKQWQRGEG